MLGQQLFFPREKFFAQLKEHRRRLGAETLANLIDLRLGEQELARQLDQAGLSPERCVLVAVQGGSSAGERHLHLSLDRHRICHLLLRRAWRKAEAPAERPRWWPMAFTGICLFEGLGWGWAMLFLVKPGHYDSELLVLAVTLSVAAASISVCGLAPKSSPTLFRSRLRAPRLSA